MCIVCSKERLISTTNELDDVEHTHAPSRSHANPHQKKKQHSTLHTPLCVCAFIMHRKQSVNLLLAIIVVISWVLDLLFDGDPLFFDIIFGCSVFITVIALFLAFFLPAFHLWFLFAIHKNDPNISDILMTSLFNINKNNSNSSSSSSNKIIIIK